MYTDFNAIKELSKLVKPLRLGVQLARFKNRIEETGASLWVMASAADASALSWVDLGDAIAEGSFIL